MHPIVDLGVLALTERAVLPMLVGVVHRIGDVERSVRERQTHHFLVADALLRHRVGNRVDEDLGRLVLAGCVFRMLVGHAGIHMRFPLDMSH